MLESLRTLVHDLFAWVESLAASAHAEWALFSVAFAESSFFPVPPDALLIPMCLARPDKAMWFAALCSVGSVLGGIVGYGIGRYGGRPVLYRFFSGPKIKAVERYYDRWNAWATGVAGLTPLPYKVFTIAGGAFAVSFKVFVIASILSRSLRFLLVATLIYFYGESINRFIEAHLGWLSLAFVLLLFGGYLLITHAGKRASRQPLPSEAGAAVPDDQAGNTAP